MAEAPPHDEPGNGRGPTPPTLMGSAAEGSRDTVPVRIARFDGEHPHGVPADADPATDVRGTAVGVATPPGGTAVVGPEADTAEVPEGLPLAPPLTPPV